MASNLSGQQTRIGGQRLHHKHFLALCTGKWLEFDLESESAQRGLVEPFQQIGGADEDAVVALHALQHFVHFGHLIGALRTAAVHQKAVGLVQQQHGLLAFSFAEHGGHLLFGFAHELAHQVAGLFDDEWFFKRCGNVLAQGGFASAWCAVKTQSTVAAGLQRFDDAWHFVAAFEVEH